MKREQLKQFENQKVCIFLKNNLRYTNIFFKFEGELIRFFDTREEEYFYLEPDCVFAISIKKRGVENGS